MHHPLRRAPGRRTTRLAALFAGLLLALPAVAAANPFPNTKDLTVADNDVHTYCYTSTFVTDPTVASYAMDVLDSTTDLTDLISSTTPNCAYMETDVWWWETDLPAGTRGSRKCWLESPTGICTSSDVKLDYPELDIGAYDWEDRRKTGVHELGHSIGLGHDTISAMMSGQVPDASLTWRRYSAHDLGHINAYY
jgi:hypothetical protein